MSIYTGQTLKLVFDVLDENALIVDLSVGTVTIAIVLKCANKAQKNFTGTLLTDGTDGAITYTTTANTDLDTAGKWQAQAIVTIDGDVYPTSIVTFTVEARI